MGLITACYVFLGWSSIESPVFSLGSATTLLAQLAPMLLVAYITTMFSADIRYGLNKAKLLSETDELTGIYNMRGFYLITDRAFAQAVRYLRPVSVLMIDSDNLKAVNDEHGHDAGNELLRLIATGIKAQLRTTDVLARYGGDEFVVLLPDAGPAGTRDVAERIRDSIARRPLELRDRSVPITVSIGLASYPDDGHGMETIMRRADEAMYRAKAGGRNRVVSFSDSENA
jgi:diguanylate cyclase (GGDEF)-like protein